MENLKVIEKKCVKLFIILKMENLMLNPKDIPSSKTEENKFLSKI
jgi:hypothetical protein